MDLGWRHLAFSALVLVLSLILAAFGQLERPSECDEGGSFKPVLICYFGIVSFEEDKFAYPRNFSIKDFDAKTCTHLVYSFAMINSESFTLDYPAEYAAIRTVLKRKKSENPCLKLILAVGGENSGKMFRDALALDITTKTLVDSITAEVAYTPWDGVDIDWEYPELVDKERFTRFMEFLKCRLRCRVCSLNRRRNGEISLALSGSPFKLDPKSYGYDFKELNNFVDYYNVMAYDYHSFKSDDREQKHHAPVYRHHTDKFVPGEKHEYWERVNALDSIITLTCAGADITKLVLGFPTYGYIWEMQFPWSHEYGRTATGQGPAGTILQRSGVWTMAEFCLNLTTSKRQWTHVFDYEVMAPYAYTAENLDETFWYSYDNEITVIEKADLAVGDNRRYPAYTCPADSAKPGDFEMTEKLAGLMIWTIEYDDCNNICEGWVPCPLISAARKRLNFWANKYRTEYEATSTTTTTTTTTEGPEPDPEHADSKYCAGFTTSNCDPCKELKPLPTTPTPPPQTSTIASTGSD